MFFVRQKWKWFLLVPLTLFLLLQMYFFAQIAWWVHFNPESTRFMRQQLSVLRQKNPRAQLKHKWVPYNRISIHLKKAVIASEDAHFSEHEGVDWDGLMRAYEKNVKKGKVVAGGSTITQQLAKNLFLSGSRSYLRKAQELLITFMLEMLMDKQRIFEIYLNVVEMGTGIFGAEAASRHYYHIPAASLGPVQAARLAVMLPNPRYFGARPDSIYLAYRTEVILNRMGSAELPRKKPVTAKKKARRKKSKPSG
ncbi:MAG: monofunctional biosynthetic peptidoglycan transglycosylase [Burkholderiaceae bacterium]|nr:monofunctional biosynthetic peptidoglycan transglycosylase [Burkholderiaceae bacterium]